MQSVMSAHQSSLKAQEGLGDPALNSFQRKGRDGVVLTGEGRSHEHGFMLWFAGI